MIDLKEKCTDCIHQPTCKYCDFYKSYFEDISECVKKFEHDKLVTVEITCEYYTKIVPNARGGLK